jgi:CBS domain containing-hemolysin-like protein
MTYTALIWLLLNILSIIVLAFYSMMEMACVSFNKVRLHYYISKGVPRALKLNELLSDPAKLFGTTLVGVNVAMIFGSEFAREFHLALGLNPDLAPLSQVLLVVIFGELAPMFAARSYSEHIVMLGIPFLYASAKIMTPILWVLGGITRLCNYLLKGKESSDNIYLSQEELRKILEEQEEELPYTSDKKQFNMITNNIFNLRSKSAKQVMKPLEGVVMLSSSGMVKDAAVLFAEGEIRCLPIYHNQRSNVVAIAFPRDLIRADDKSKVRDHAKVPWFVTQTTRLTHILKQFRRNAQEIVVILDKQGHAIGMIHLDDIIEEIFGKILPMHANEHTLPAKKMIIIDRTFPGKLTVGEFKRQFDVAVDANDELTLEELMTELLGHSPEVEESIYLEPFEFTVVETSLLSVKKVHVTTKIG